MVIWLHRVNAVLFAAIGILILFRARSSATSLGIEFTQTQGLTDFRATYGGMCLALGIFFTYATYREAWLLPASVLGILLYAGLGITRAAGLICDGSPSPLMVIFLFCEVLLVTLNTLAARS